MKILMGLMALAVLASCGNQSKNSAFLCPNGPNLAVTYVEDMAILNFNSGRSEELRLSDPDNPNFFSAPGISWMISGFRTARLNDGRSSYGCDEVG